MKMKTACRVFFAFFTLSAHLSFATLTGYVSTNSASSAIYATNFDTGSQTLLGATGINGIVALAASASGDFYAVGTNPPALWRINKQTGAGTQVCGLGAYVLYEIAFDKQGFCYGVDYGTGKLIKIDTSSGSLSVAGSTSPYNYIYALAVSPQGTAIAYSLYPRMLLQIDLQTAQVTPLGAFAGTVGDFDFASDGTLYDFTYNAIYKVNMGSLSMTLVRTVPNGVTQNPRTNGFALDWRHAYIVSASCSAGGSLSPSGTFYRYPGESVTFTATPDSGFQVDSWTLNGSVVQTGGTMYTLAVTTNSNLAVTFHNTAGQFAITAKAGTGGTILPSGTLYRNSGDTIQFTASPAAGYSPNCWYVDGDQMQIGQSTFSVYVVSDSNVLVTFGKPVMYADAKNTSGPWDGSAQHPFRTIQQGADATLVEGTVIIAPGTYHESVTTDKNLILQSADPNDPCSVAATILDASGFDYAVTSYSYIQGWCSCTINGLTIENSNYAGVTADDLSIQNSVLTRHRGMAVEVGTIGLTMTNCKINYNAVGISGPDGGEPRINLDQCELTYNGTAAEFGENIVNINSCRICYNSGSALTGNETDFYISDTTIADNGSGISGDNNGAILTDTRILNNRGDGVNFWDSIGYPLQLTNSIVADNLGCSISSDAGTYLVNSTIVDNGTGVIFLDLSEPRITDSIIWGNTGSQIMVKGTNDADPNVMYSDIQGSWPGTGNINADPLFADAANTDPNKRDYHEKSQAGRWNPVANTWVLDTVTRPCIDAGNPNDSYANEPQPNGGRVNMGAYGDTAEASKTFTPVPDLIGWWKFDDNGGTAPVDSSGYNKTGKFISSPVWTSGKFSGALTFDGINDAVQVPTNLMSSQKGTVSLWIYPRAFDSNPHYLFGHVSSTSWANRIQLYTNDPAGYLDLGLGGTHTLRQGIYRLSVNTWYHVALTWNSGTYNVYVNGILRANGTYSGLTTLGSFADIGNDGCTTSRTESFNGTIDDVRIYSRALTASEIAKIFKP
jgi:hypothetical protein